MLALAFYKNFQFLILIVPTPFEFPFELEPLARELLFAVEFPKGNCKDSEISSSLEASSLYWMRFLFAVLAG